MPYTIKPSDNGKYIILKFTGDLTNKLALAGTLESHALGNKLGIRRYLVDVTESRNVESTTANYSHGYHGLKTEGIDMTARVAAVVNKDDSSHNFFETVAKNAGHNITLFKDLDSAIRHLENENAK